MMRLSRSKFDKISDIDKAGMVITNLGIVRECKKQIKRTSDPEIIYGLSEIVDRYEKMSCQLEYDSSQKDKLRRLLDKQKIETITKNFSTIEKYVLCYLLEESKTCDLLNGDISIRICKGNDIEKWRIFEHLTTSLPYRDAVGRQLKLFVLCDNKIVGMLHITSPLLQNRLRDNYLNWNVDIKFNEKEINRIYNIQTCVSLRSYSRLLTGKLLVYCCFSNEVKSILKDLYGDDPLGIEVTSLFGKSSLYNRIPFLKYLGLSEGYSAIYISSEEWKAVLKEYDEVFPDSKGTKLKFQILDKLAAHYKKIGKEFPYIYKSDLYKRGIYFGYFDDTILSDRVNQWRERWLKMRLQKGIS